MESSFILDKNLLLYPKTVPKVKTREAKHYQSILLRYSTGYDCGVLKHFISLDRNDWKAR